MSTPKISVIVPVYNVERYLPRCIDSILAQTFTDFELLLIDDGSKDSSGEICDEYASKDSRVRVFHKENGGVSSARNLGLDNARGEWIAFCDSDDWVKPEFLGTFIGMAGDCDLLSQGFHSFNWHNAGDKDIAEATGLYQGDRFLPFLLQLQATNQLGFIWCKAFRRKVINGNGIRFDTSIKLMEDLVFVLQYCECGNGVSNSGSCHYQYKFTEPGRNFGNQDNFGVQRRVYLSFKRLDKDGNYSSHIKAHFCDHIVNNLICAKFTASSLRENVRFVAEEFGQCLRRHESIYRKVRLFWLLFSKKCIWYDCLLTRAFRMVYSLVERNSQGLCIFYFFME